MIPWKLVDGVSALKTQLNDGSPPGVQSLRSRGEQEFFLEVEEPKRSQQARSSRAAGLSGNRIATM